MTFAALAAYGWNDRWAALLADVDAPGAVPGRVVRHDGVALGLALPEGVRQVHFARTLDPAPAVGDWVVVSGGAPVAVLPRTSLLTRRAAFGDGTQQLAANVDGVLVVCGLDRPVRAGRIDRFVTLAWDAGAVPTVVLAKADLADDAAAIAEEVAAAHPGLDVVTASVVDDHGIDAVRALAAGRTVVLVGESGAGKSSLTNALLGDEIMAVAEVRAGDAKGRHTTTTREAHPLPGGGVLIDTPGIRAVGLDRRPRRRRRHLRRHRRPRLGLPVLGLRPRGRAGLRGHRGRRGGPPGARAPRGLAGARARGRRRRAAGRPAPAPRAEPALRADRARGATPEGPGSVERVPCRVSGGLEAAERLELEAQLADLFERGVDFGGRGARSAQHGHRAALLDLPAREADGEARRGPTPQRDLGHVGHRPIMRSGGVTSTHPVRVMATTARCVAESARPLT